MQTLLRFLILAVVLGLHSVPVAAHEGYARTVQRQRPATERSSRDVPDEFMSGTLGVCRLYNLSGYQVIDALGQLVPLGEYCAQRRNWVAVEDGKFWQAFREAASDEVIAFTRTLSRESVYAYGTAICPFLQEGGTVQALRQLHRDQQLPAAFEEAILTAAITTYCPRLRQR